jgi:hypothetical protein
MWQPDVLYHIAYGATKICKYHSKGYQTHQAFLPYRANMYCVRQCTGRPNWGYVYRARCTDAGVGFAAAAAAAAAALFLVTG